MSRYVVLLEVSIPLEVDIDLDEETQCQIDDGIFEEHVILGDKLLDLPDIVVAMKDCSIGGYYRQ